MNHSALIENLSEPLVIILSINSDWSWLQMKMDKRDRIGLDVFWAQDISWKLFSDWAYFIICLFHTKAKWDKTEFCKKKKTKKTHIYTSDNWKLKVVGLPLMTVLQRLTFQRVQQSPWNCAFLCFICIGCSWYAVANPVLWANGTGWTKVTVTHSFSFLIPFKTKGKNLSDFCLRACYIATVRALSGLGLCLLPDYLPNIKIANVIPAMDHKPLDLSGKKWREEGQKEGMEEGRKEKENPSKAYPPNKITYLIFPFQEMTWIHPWNCLSQKPGIHP